MLVKVEMIVNVPDDADVDDYLNEAEFTATGPDGTDIYEEIRDWVPRLQE